MIDLHSHILAGVDDGAANLVEAAKAIDQLFDSGVRRLIATPHFRASELAADDGGSALDRFDRPFRLITELASSRFPGLSIGRGVELMLDAPQFELTDPRLRLGGSRAVLVEFPQFIFPPHAERVLAQLAEDGWRPVLAHPERYRNVEGPDYLGDLRSAGCLLQINHGSISGRYGKEAGKLAWELLRAGIADLLSSDYHARGTPRIREARSVFADRGSLHAFEILTELNPARLLGDEEIEDVPPVHSSPTLLSRLFRGA